MPNNTTAVESTESTLTHRLSLPQIKRLSRQASTDAAIREQLVETIFSPDTRVATNALWAFTHFDDDSLATLAPIYGRIVRLSMTATHTSIRRLTLNILLRLPTDDNIDIDFLNYCINRITATTEPYAIRALAMKIAFNLCRHYPPLLDELTLILDLLDAEPLSPGLKSALKHTRKAIAVIIKKK